MILRSVGEIIDCHRVPEIFCKKMGSDYSGTKFNESTYANLVPE